MTPRLADETDCCPLCGWHRIFSVTQVAGRWLFLGLYCGTCRTLTSPEGLLEPAPQTIDGHPRGQTILVRERDYPEECRRLRLASESETTSP